MKLIPQSLIKRSKLRLVVYILTPVIASLADSSMGAAQGDLDSSFGTGGIVTTNFTANQDTGTDVALQSDGKIVVVGYSLSGSDLSTADFALARYNADGTLDSTFGTNGKVTTDFNGGQDVALDVAVQADGRIVTAGRSENGSETDFALARYNTDGSLDSTFGADGKVRSAFTDPNGFHKDTFGRAVALEADGKIVVAGYINDVVIGPGYEFAISRYEPNGDLDSTFGIDGWVTPDFPPGGPTSRAASVVIQPDGKIVVGGWTGTFGGSQDFALKRYDSGGNLDTSFGSNHSGEVATDFVGSLDAITSLALQSDGSIIAAGYSFYSDSESADFALARYSADGTLDESFGDGGLVATAFADGDDIISDLIIQPNGLIIAAGIATLTAENSAVALARYNPDGSLSQTFGEGGKVLTEISSSFDGCTGLALQPDGKLVAAGYTGTDEAFAVARYLTAGAPSLNISTRADVETGDNVLIGGFIVAGTEPKEIIVRAIGPSIPVGGMSGVLADPVLELHESDGTVITNDNWRDTQEQEIMYTGLAPNNDLESAIVATLEPGAYTAIVRGNKGGTGIALVEAYDLDQAAPSVLANISTRGLVDTGDKVMIGGFILGGEEDSATVVIRGLGPSLSDVGVANALSDPTLELHDSNGGLVSSDDDWKDSQQTEIEAAGLAPTYDKEAAIFANLSSGAYTAVLQGKNNSTGVGLVETITCPEIGNCPGADAPSRVPGPGGRFAGVAGSLCGRHGCL